MSGILKLETVIIAFAFRVLINTITFNIFLKVQKPKLSYLKENYPSSSIQTQFYFFLLNWKKNVFF